jgi:hypothetical protein
VNAKHQQGPGVKLQSERLTLPTPSQQHCTPEPACALRSVRRVKIRPPTVTNDTDPRAYFLPAQHPNRIDDNFIQKHVGLQIAELTMTNQENTDIRLLTCSVGVN